MNGGGVKALKIVGVIVGVLLVVAVLLGGYFGVVPWVSGFLGPKPRDLGVAMTVPEATAAAKAIGMPVTSKDLTRGLANPDSLKRFDNSLTSEQASSLLAIGQTGIPDFPLVRVQLKFGSGGNAEAAGNINFPSVKPFLTGLGVPADAADKAMSKVLLTTSMPFYISGNCSVKSNHVSLALAEVQLGRLTVPKGWYAGKEGAGTKYIDGALTKNGFKVDSLTIDGGQCKLSGERPLSSLSPWLKLVQQ